MYTYTNSKPVLESRDSVSNIYFKSSTRLRSADAGVVKQELHLFGRRTLNLGNSLKYS